MLAGARVDENQYNKTLNHKSHISIQLTARAVAAAVAAAAAAPTSTN